MLKFLRKYQAWILAIGGSLLMVAFLLPEAIQRLGTPSMNRRLFQLTIDGSPKKVRFREWQEAGAEMVILETMFNTRDIGPLLNFPPTEDGSSGRSGLRGVDHWFLLKTEARLAGLIGGVSDGDDQIRQQAASIAARQRQAVDDVYDGLIRAVRNEAGRLKLTLDQGKEAFATLAGIGRLIDGYAGSSVASDVRARHIVQAFEDRINIAMVFVDAENHIADLPEPEQAVLESHFEKYRDVEPGMGEQGFGYRLSDRVKIEYLTIKYESVYDMVEASGLEARKWYQRNAAQVAQDRANPPPFDEVAADVIAAYRRSKAEESMTEIGRFIRSELIRSTQALARDGEYRVLPEDWPQKRVSFEALREAVQAKFNVTVEYHADTQKWQSLSDLATLEGIGSATRVAGAGLLSLRQLVEAHRELGREGPPGLQAGLADSNLLRRSEFNRGRIGPTSYPADAFVYRVLEVDPARPPRSMDEVREAVVKDVKRLQAFEGLRADLDSWRARAINEGLDDLAKSLDTSVRRGSISRYGTASSTMGDYKPNAIAGISSKILIDAVFQRAESFEPLTRYSDLPNEERLVVSAVPEQLGIALVRMESHSPVTRQRWQGLVNSGLWISSISSQSAIPLSQVVMYRDFTDREMEPFSFEAMKAKFNFVDLRSPMDREQDEQEAMSAGEGG